MLDSRRSRLIFALLALQLALGQAWAREALLGIRLGLHPDGSTRLVLDLAEPSAYRIGLLATPDRLYIELPSAEAPGSLPGGRGLIRSFSLAREPGLLRLIAQLGGPIRLTKADLIPGTAGGPSRRLVVDLAPASAVSFAAALAAGPIDSDPPIVLGDDQTGAGSAAATTSGAVGAGATTTGEALPAPFAPASDIPSLKPEAAASGFVLTAVSSPAEGNSTLVGATQSQAQLAAASTFWPSVVPMLKPGSPPAMLPLIYIDPGHGGDDPGTVGRSGVYEKDVTIAVAKELQRQLIDSGRYRVKLTRETDRFVALRDRFELARQDHADLFISLHADANPFYDARGATVYTLSETASDAEAEAIAAKENKSDLIDGVDLSNQNKAVTSILIDLAQRETKNRSAAFAELLVHEMAQVTLMLRHSHRFAGFAVLKAPDIPSVLIELGYLSDPQDEALLLSPAHRANLTRAMLHAIDGYFFTEMASGTRS